MGEPYSDTATRDIPDRVGYRTETVSVGVAVATFRGGEIEDGAALLHRADLAMYAEKRQGTHGRRLYTAEVPALVSQ